MRPSLFRAAWTLTWPVRAYIRYSPIRRGKALLARSLLQPLLPHTTHPFKFATRDGAKFELEYREALGETIALYGAFEEQEVQHLVGRIVPGSTAFDVGANVGFYSVRLARALGSSGRVVAFEPLAGNVARLTAHLAMNQVDNVDIVETAVLDREGEVEIWVADDAAFSSTEERGATSSYSKRVPTTTLDADWRRRRCPDVSVLKVDVEGAELQVLRGGVGLISACGPTILAEARTDDDLHPLEQFLAELGYVWRQPRGFEPWNFLFERRQTR